jgi:hypothetical protein
MPKAFEVSGVLLGTVMLVILTVISFITVTFMFESMSIANAVKRFTHDENKTLKCVYSNYGINGIGEPADKDEDTDQSNAQNSRIGEVTFEEHSQVALNYDVGVVNTSTTTLVTENTAFSINNLEKRQADRLFAINEKFEMGEMAGMFFNKTGQLFFLHSYDSLLIW